MVEDDSELAALRARRRSELLARVPGARKAAEPPPPLAELSAATLPGFLQTNPRAVVDVWAPWCGPCQAMRPVLEALARDLAPDVRFGKLNADDEPEVAGRWNVEAIPTLLVFFQGRLLDRMVGALPQGELELRLRSVYRLGPGGDLGEEEGS